MKYFLIFIVLALLLFLYYKFFKIPKFSSLVSFVGAPKSGKSTTATYFAVKSYKKIRRRTKISNFFRKIFKKPLLEMPLIYSNIPLAIPYVKLDKDLLLRRCRFRYRSVVLINEASLIADSRSALQHNSEADEVNEQIKLFFKLIGHELRSGNCCCFLDTQTPDDLHVQIRRTLSQQFYIHHCRKWFILPFITVYCREMLYSDESNIQNTISLDVEEDLKRIIITKSVWKVFDSYSYANFTDNLPVSAELSITDDLQAYDIVSFNKFRRLINDEKKES